jgi:hypothetical protein
MDQTLPPSILLFAPAKGSPSKSASGRNLGIEVYAISVEVPAVFNLDEDLQSGGDIVPTDYKQIFVTPAVRLNLFPGTRVFTLGELGRRFRPFQREQSAQLFRY